MADYTITGDTKLDAGGFNKGLSSMTVAAGTLIADLAKTATSKLAGLAQVSVGVGMSFDASMSQVAATMGTSVDQIQNLTDTAKEMGSTTAFTATQAADALNYLALAGYDANKAAEVLPSVLNLAAAGGMDLAYASDLVTDAMASLNIEANKQNVDEFGNKLAMAASRANANVAQLGEAILTVGGTAANLKGGTTELTTALGLLANVGIKGAEGGTHLRNIILSLQSPTKDAREVMEQLGLEVYDTQGNMRQLDDILTDLNTVMDGMTQGDKDGIINALFNKTDLAAVNGLLAAQGEQWETLATQIDNAGDAMGQMADTQLDNLQGAVTIMQSALEGLQLAIYDKMEPALKVLAQGATETISTLTTILSQDGPAAMLDAAVTIIGSLVNGITQKIPMVMSAATGTEIIDGVERTVKTVTTIAADGTKTVSKTIEDAGPQFSSAAELLTHQFTEKLDSSWEQINKSIQSDVVGSIKTLLQAIKDGDLESIATWSAAYFWNACTKEQRTQIQTFAMDALSKLSGSLSGVFKNLASLAAGFVGQFVPAAAAATGAQEGLNIAMDANPILLVVSLIGMLVGALGSFISTNKSASSSVKSIWGGIGDFMSYIFEGLLRVYGAYLQGFVNIINGLIAVYNSVAWLWDGKIDPVSNIAFDYADKIRKDREERKAAEKAEAENAKAQAQLDAQYAEQSGTAEKKQLDAKYNKKLAELEKAKLTKDDPGMLEAEKKVLAAGYEQDLADLEKKVLDAQYKLASAQLEQKTATDATRLAELEKQINEAQNVIQMSDLEKQLLGVEYQKSLAELIAKYQPKKDSTSSSGNGSSGSSSGSSGTGTPVPAPDTGHDEVIAANTAALQEANKKLSEMVRQANALVLSDNMKVSSRVAASGTAQVAAAANNYHREGDTTVNQYIYSKAQSAADLARETRWEADRAKARKT